MRHRLDLLPFATLALAAALGGCKRAPDVVGSTKIANLQASQNDVDDSGNIQCAPRGQAEFARTCTLDSVASPKGTILTVHNEDGGFHRLLVTKNGLGVVAADGAMPAHVAVVGADRIEVTIAGDRYRLPATVKGAHP